MNTLDFVVLISSMLGIVLYGMWHARGQRDLKTYVKGRGDTPWFTIGLSVMATQASAITFLSVPGQGYLGGADLVQMYFGMPVALIIIAVIFLPLFQKLNVFTAYEYLGRRFDGKTRLLGAALFLAQRGLGAGLTIYAPAIVFSSVFGWSLDMTIICSGTLVIIYTVMGGSDAVTVTQKYQFGVIYAGMLIAFGLLLSKLPAGLTLTDSVTLAGHFHRLHAVSFSPSIHERYTFWSGIFGGTFLMLSYFGTDQSQVQRYISGASMRESRLGLMFNAVCKIPMQFGILLLGVFLFVFYQFAPAPLFFNHASRQYMIAHGHSAQVQEWESEYRQAQAQTRVQLETWLADRHDKDVVAANTTNSVAVLSAAVATEQQGEQIRANALMALQNARHTTTTNDNDYVFITFILNYLPHGVIGLLVAAFFAAALSSKSAELNALGSCTTIDVYKHLKCDASDRQCLLASKWFTALWGVVAIAFALFAHLSENLIQAVNILGSIFYGVMLGLFVVAFFIRSVGGTAVFWAAVVAQSLVCVLYHELTISFLWYPLIGCGACVLVSLVLQPLVGGKSPPHPATA